MLNSTDAEYCVMNNYDNLPDIIPSDVDIAVDLHTFQKLDSLIKRLADDHNVSITQKIWHGYNKCAFILSPIEIQSYFYLQLDFFVDFCGSGFPNLFPNNLMQHAKKRYKNFYVPAVEVEVPFLLQRRIFKGDINDRHVQILVKLFHKNREAVSRSIKGIFGDGVGNSLITFIETESVETFNDNYFIYQKKLKEISSFNTSILYRVKYMLWQFIRAMYRLYYPTGISIAFVGENTQLKKELIEKFDAIVSGSFYGLASFAPSNLLEYIKYIMIEGYWSKVTKKKVFLNMNTLDSDWKQAFSNRLLTYILPMPDVVVCLEKNIGKLSGNTTNNIVGYKLNKKDDFDKILLDLTCIVLSKQVQQTKKHLMNRISPTG